jgi:hypothetical protein
MPSELTAPFIAVLTVVHALIPSSPPAAASMGDSCFVTIVHVVWRFHLTKCDGVRIICGGDLRHGAVATRLVVCVRGARSSVLFRSLYTNR